MLEAFVRDAVVGAARGHARQVVGGAAPEAVQVVCRGGVEVVRTVHRVHFAQHGQARAPAAVGQREHMLQVPDRAHVHGPLGGL